MIYKCAHVERDGSVTDGPVVYWMQREQRVHDNWPLLFAQSLALEHNRELIVVFNLVPEFLEATIRQYGFMLKGLAEVSEKLPAFNITFRLLKGDPVQNIPAFLSEVSGSILVTDFNPLKIIRHWKKGIKEKTDVPFYTVDGHNIIPCWELSDKEEFAAYTIRPKVNKKLPFYMEEYPDLIIMPERSFSSDFVDPGKEKESLKINFDVPEVNWIKPGEDAARDILDYFLTKKILKYNDNRNDPNLDVLSNLSPYLHFGHISAQTIALDVNNRIKNDELKKSFLEELIVRRELADNFCFYNKNYDNFCGIKDWAKTTLNDHRKDEREFIYSLSQFENSETHDPLWNAAQNEMKNAGKMHGYMRMYWAKKILEWTASPEDAINTAIYLNDKYELDGRDPNGYTGVLWSVGGIHDRAWKERPVFGKIRYMNFNGCKRKFDVKSYINKHSG